MLLNIKRIKKFRKKNLYAKKRIHVRDYDDPANFDNDSKNRGLPDDDDFLR